MELNIELLIFILVIIGSVVLFVLLIVFNDRIICINDNGYGKRKKSITNSKYLSKRDKQIKEFASKSYVVFLFVMLLVFIINHYFVKNILLIKFIYIYWVFIYSGFLLTTILDALKDSRKLLNGKVVSIAHFILMLPLYLYYLSYPNWNLLPVLFWFLRFIITLNLLNCIYLSIFIIDNIVFYIKTCKNGIRIFRQINDKYIVCGLLLVLLIPIYIVENVYNFIIFVISKRTLLWWFITNFCISLFFSFVTVYIDAGDSKEFSLFNSIFIIIVLPLGINLLFNRK